MYFCDIPKKAIKAHWLLTLLIMCASALVLGLSSYNLFHYFQANLDFISEYGIVYALQEGAITQFLGLCLYGVISIISYVIFKACEKTLVEILLK